MLSAEQECTIRWDQEQKTAYIWTNIPSVQKKLDKLCKHPSLAYICLRRRPDGTMYQCPANLVTFRQPVSEETRAKRREIARMKSALRFPTPLPTFTTSDASDDTE